MQHILEKAKNIRLVIFDVDGVLTDGTLYLTDSGEEIKAFNSQDGHGLKMLKASGVGIALITGRQSRCVDLIDLPVMLRCGLAITVPAAPAFVKRHAHHVTRLEGGRGAVREICELIMHAQETLDAQLAAYLK